PSLASPAGPQGGRAERRLAAIAAGRSTRESLARLGGPDPLDGHREEIHGDVGAEQLDRIGRMGPIGPADDLPIDLEQRDDLVVSPLLPEELGQDVTAPLGRRAGDRGRPRGGRPRRRRSGLGPSPPGRAARSPGSRTGIRPSRGPRPPAPRRGGPRTPCRPRADNPPRPIAPNAPRAGRAAPRPSGNAPEPSLVSPARGRTASAIRRW